MRSGTDVGQAGWQVGVRLSEKVNFKHIRRTWICLLCVVELVFKGERIQKYKR